MMMMMGRGDGWNGGRIVYHEMRMWDDEVRDLWVYGNVQGMCSGKRGYGTVQGTLETIQKGGNVLGGEVYSGAPG